MSQRTVMALMTRGVDSLTARQLANNSYTLAKLKSLTLKELRGLGILKEAAQNILDEKRPAISPSTAFNVLCKSLRRCCVCHDKNRGIVIHHLKEWSVSHDHSEDNLAVLCLSCHGDAHTKHELSKNLTAREIRKHREKWHREVQDQQRKQLLNSNGFSFLGGTWEYFNHNRLAELANKQEVEIHNLKHYHALVQARQIKRTGEPSWNNERGNREDAYYLYDGLGLVDKRMYFFYEALFKELVETTGVVNLSENWSHSFFSSCVFPGSIVAFAGGWRFKSIEKTKRTGPEQWRMAYVQKRRIRLEFPFDRWDTTSGSAATNLAGSHTCTGYALVQEITRRGNVKVYEAKGLAIGTGFT